MESTLMLVLTTLVELALLGAVAFFFIRLKKSEHILQTIQARQIEFVNKLHFNAQLETELMQSFERRQVELARLDELLAEKSRQLGQLVKNAETFTKSPRFLRQVILDGHGEGRMPAELARSTGLSVDEVELILSQSGN